MVRTRRSGSLSTLLFPGLRPGEQLTREVKLPPRATLFARDGTPLAQGPDRSSPIPDVASQIVGTLGPIPAALASRYAAEGYPRDAKVGTDGLERIFERQLAGTPGGVLLAGSRPLAHRAPRSGHDVTTTISVPIERAAVAAMGGNYAGIAAMQPSTGQVLALAGVAFSALQPPGSTMKIITSTGALEAGLVTLGTTFPIETSATIDGFNLQNASGEACGGTFLNAFAVSCNSVFAPLGAKLGAQRLVNVAERYGFNQQPTIPGAAEPTIPTAKSIGDSLAVGSSAIGQGAVQASALEMTDVAATIANGGQRPLPTLQMGKPPTVRARDELDRGGRGAEDDGRGRAVRDRHLGRDPRRHGRGQDRDRGAEGHRRPGSEHRVEHRRVVRRLRPGGSAEDRRRRTVPQPGRRRPDRRAGRRPGDPGGAVAVGALRFLAPAAAGRGCRSEAAPRSLGGLCGGGWSSNVTLLAFLDQPRAEGHVLPWWLGEMGV